MTQEQNMDRKCVLVPGQVVQSKQGRDRAGVFLVLEILDAKHVLVVDGRRRKLANPKKKRIIHLQPHRVVAADFEAMKERNEYHDACIRKILSEYVNNKEETHVGQGRH